MKLKFVDKPAFRSNLKIQAEGEKYQIRELCESLWTVEKKNQAIGKKLMNCGMPIKSSI